MCLPGLPVFRTNGRLRMRMGDVRKGLRLARAAHVQSRRFPPRPGHTAMRTLPPLHPTDADFAAIRAEGSFHVDKTGVLRALLATTSTYRLATRHQFLARPRRFGKTLLINTLEAWFQGLPPGHRANPEGDTEPLAGLPAGWTSPPWLWEGLDAQDWHGTHGWHPVIRLNLSRAAASSGSLPGGPGGYGTAPGASPAPSRPRGAISTTATASRICLRPRASTTPSRAPVIQGFKHAVRIVGVRHPQQDNLGPELYEIDPSVQNVHMVACIVA